MSHDDSLSGKLVQAPTTLHQSSPAGMFRGSENIAPSIQAGYVRPRASSPRLRGAVLHAIDGALARIHGKSARERVLALLPATASESLLRGPPSSLDAHSAALVGGYLEAMIRGLSIDASAIFELGRAAVDEELTPFVRTLVHPADPTELSRRVALVLGAFLEFGSWEAATPNPRLAVHTLTRLSALPPLARPWFAGVTQRIYERAVSTEARVVDATPSDVSSDSLVLHAVMPNP